MKALCCFLYGLEGGNFVLTTLNIHLDGIQFVHMPVCVCLCEELKMAEGESAAATPREIQILETPEDIQARREQVLSRYALFKDATKAKRQKLEDARRYMYFKRDADELESWINEKLQTASDESYRDPTNLQVCDSKLSVNKLV